MRGIDWPVRFEIAGLSLEASRSGGGRLGARVFSPGPASARSEASAHAKFSRKSARWPACALRKLRSDAARGDSVSRRALVLLRGANRSAGCACYETEPDEERVLLIAATTGYQVREFAAPPAPGRRSGARHGPLSRARRSLGRSRGAGAVRRSVLTMQALDRARTVRRNRRGGRPAGAVAAQAARALGSAVQSTGRGARREEQIPRAGAFPKPDS